MIVTEPTIPGIIAIMPAKDSAFFQALGCRIAQARKERGMTQQALAEALGIAQQTLGHYEVARARIAADLLPRLADALDLSLDELLKGQPTIRLPGKRGPASRLERNCSPGRLMAARSCEGECAVDEIADGAEG